MLRRGRHGFADASDDNHNSGVFDDVFGVFIVVKARALTYDSIIKAPHLQQKRK